MKEVVELGFRNSKSYVQTLTALSVSTGSWHETRVLLVMMSMPREPASAQGPRSGEELHS